MTPAEVIEKALRAHRRRQQAQNRRLEELRDRLALVVAERRAAWREVLYGPDDAEEVSDVG